MTRNQALACQQRIRQAFPHLSPEIRENGAKPGSFLLAWDRALTEQEARAVSRVMMRFFGIEEPTNGA